MTFNVRTIPNKEVREGNFQIVLEGKIIGTLDVAKYQDNTYVTVELVDCFLTIGQFSELLEKIKTEFSLPNDQKICIHQI